MDKFEEAVAAMPAGARAEFLRKYRRHPEALKALCRKYPPMTSLTWRGRTFWVMGYVEKPPGFHHELVLSPLDPHEDARLANTFTGEVCPRCYFTDPEAN